MGCCHCVTCFWLRLSQLAKTPYRRSVITHYDTFSLRLQKCRGLCRGHGRFWSAPAYVLSICKHPSKPMLSFCKHPVCIIPASILSASYRQASYLRYHSHRSRGLACCHKGPGKPRLESPVPKRRCLPVYGRSVPPCHTSLP